MLDRLRKFFRPKASTAPMESIMFLHHMQGYSGPFHVCRDWRGKPKPEAQCVRLNDGRLHVYQAGGFPDLLNGHGYILASRALANLLQDACGPSVRIVPAQVINVATGETLARHHFEVLPHEELTRETLKAVDASGSCVWHFRKSHLFRDDEGRPGFATSRLHVVAVRTRLQWVLRRRGECGITRRCTVPRPRDSYCDSIGRRRGRGQ